MRKTEARASERYWARVGGIFKEPDELARELFSDEFRKGVIGNITLEYPKKEGK